MRITQLFGMIATIASGWILTICAMTFPISTPPETARITVLYDAFSKDATMTTDWGYAALVEINGKCILFDTGGDPAIFAKNVKAKVLI